MRCFSAVEFKKESVQYYLDKENEDANHFSRKQWGSGGAWRCVQDNLGTTKQVQSLYTGVLPSAMYNGYACKYLCKDL